MAATGDAARRVLAPARSLAHSLPLCPPRVPKRSRSAIAMGCDARAMASLTPCPGRGARQEDENAPWRLRGRVARGRPRSPAPRRARARRDGLDGPALVSAAPQTVRIASSARAKSKRVTK